jgi:cobalt-zinc-cadmium efflux system protein
VHDLHIWALSTTETALSVHLIKPNVETDDQMLLRISEELHHRFGIGHPTIQVECGDSANPCPQRQDHP